MASISASLPLSGELASLRCRAVSVASTAVMKWRYGAQAGQTSSGFSSLAGAALRSNPVGISYYFGPSTVRSWKGVGGFYPLRCLSGGGEGGKNLADKKCVPCEGGKGIEPLSRDDAQALLDKVPGWALQDVEGVPRLHQSYKVKNFLKGLELFQRVGQIAEEEGHHPDLHLEGWNNARIDIWTHSIRGLHMNDFILAAKINDLDKEDLLRKKKTPFSQPATST